jgi:hypothetical protein
VDSKIDPAALPYPVVGQPAQIYDPTRGDQPVAAIVTAVDPGNDPDNPAVQLTAFLSGGDTQVYKALGYDLVNGGTWGPLPPA